VPPGYALLSTPSFKAQLCMLDELQWPLALADGLVQAARTEPQPRSSLVKLCRPARL